MAWGVRMAKMVEAFVGNWHGRIKPRLPHHGPRTLPRRWHAMRIKWRRGPVGVEGRERGIISTQFDSNYREASLVGQHCIVLKVF